jgi:acetylornithine deacetylase/succinyl-diaminopimelate desuccinylase-like protein
MCDIIKVLENDFASTLARIPHALLGAPTLSVGTIQGGKAANIVPDHCTIEVDWRRVPGMRTEELLADLRKRFPDATVGEYEFYPPFHESDDSETLTRLKTSIEAVRGIPAVLTSAPWAANAGILQHETGQSCAIFGPGDIAQAHTTDEWIEWSQVEMAAEIYERLLTS